MKRLFIVTAVFTASVMLMISCTKSSPSEPDQPAATATVTPSITETFTMTSTATDTPPYTATVTPTVTATSTATPPDLYVDNFEDGNYVNAISSWGANTLTGSVIHYYGLITPPPGNGSYSFAVTATANVQPGQSLAYVNTTTGPTFSAVPMNASMYNKIRFSRLFKGNLHSGIKSVYVTIYDDSNLVQYQIGSAFSDAFEEWDINLRASYFLSGGTLDDLLGNIKQINISVYLQGSPGDSMDFNLVIDDMRFTHN